MRRTRVSSDVQPHAVGEAEVHLEFLSEPPRALFTRSVTASPARRASRSMPGMRCTGHAGLSMLVPGVFQKGAPPPCGTWARRVSGSRKRAVRPEAQRLRRVMGSGSMQAGEGRRMALPGCKVGHKGRVQAGQSLTASWRAKSSSRIRAASMKASSLAARSISRFVRAMSFSMALRSWAAM